jgi:hypothetical protein
MSLTWTTWTLTRFPSGPATLVGPEEEEDCAIALVARSRLLVTNNLASMMMYLLIDRLERSECWNTQASGRASGAGFENGRASRRMKMSSVE